MVKKKGRFGEFLACSGYPECKNARPIPTGVKCPRPGCEGQLVQKASRRGKVFYGCDRFPECDYAIWDRPINEQCPLCGHPFLVERQAKGGGKTVVCPARGCNYRKKNKS
jgi:DNA topoisomerase-1